jgi:hypothetical protein
MSTSGVSVGVEIDEERLLLLIAPERDNFRTPVKLGSSEILDC